MNPWAHIDKLSTEAKNAERWCVEHGFRLLPSEGTGWLARELHVPRSRPAAVLRGRTWRELQAAIEDHLREVRLG